MTAIDKTLFGNGNAKHINYRADIDGLRAIAVGAVVIYHAFPKKFPGGFIGVDIFFIISGFLISTILFQGLDAGVFSIVDFYRRRIKRIFPALLTILLFCLAFGWFFLLSDEYRQLGKHIAGGLVSFPKSCCWARLDTLMPVLIPSHYCTCGVWRWKNSFIFFGRWFLHSVGKSIGRFKR